VKPKITRSDFLVKFFTGEITIDDIGTVFNAYPYVYGAYMLIKPFDLDKTELVRATVSEDSSRITLTLSSEKLAKKIKKEAAKSYKFCGEEEYPVELDTKGKFLTMIFE
jgi:hypothetical protein